MIINIRGTNGSGKTTLARAFQEPGARVVNLAQYSKPTKREPDRMLWSTGVLFEVAGLGRVICVGPYHTPTGGMDALPSFEVNQDAINAAARMADHVICEGVLASTVAGSWLKFFQGREQLMGHHVLVGYLDTPVETCLERIRERQARAGRVREIKEEQVRDKVRAINATRAKFEAAGIATIDLPGAAVPGQPAGYLAAEVLRDYITRSAQ